VSSVLLLIWILVLIAAPILRAVRRPTPASWLLTALPAAASLASFEDLARGAAAVGEGTFESAEKQLVLFLLLLFVTVLAAFRTQTRWLFWAAWLMNAVVCALVVYMALFWKVFAA
jgi:hypothetical protein